MSEFGSIMVRWPLHPRATFSDAWITQLVLFDDGVRIDFQITAGEQIEVGNLEDGHRVIVDKDGLTRELSRSSLARYRLERPTAESYHALFATIDLVRTVGKRVADALGFEYPEEVDLKVTRFIRDIQELDRDYDG